MLVRDRMSKNPITIAPETTHKQATEIMREHHIHHLPVVDKNGNLVGIVVEEDLLSAQPSPATTLSIYEIHGLLSKLQIRQIMGHPVQTVTPDCPLEEAARLMLKHDIGCLPVMEEQKIVGIITDTDIFQSLVSLLGVAEEGARFTLRLADEPGMLAKVSQAVTDAGGDIISLITWHGKDSGDNYITIKERGANFHKLEKGLRAVDVEVVNVIEKPACQERQYG